MSTLPAALIFPLLIKLPPVMLPVELINPPVNMLPPVMLAALVIVLVALINPPVNKLPPVTLAVAEINPAVSTLPPVTLPDALTNPVVVCPVEENTTTFAVPSTLTVTLALAAAIETFDVPLLMLATLVITPVSDAPLPRI